MLGENLMEGAWFWKALIGHIKPLLEGSLKAPTPMRVNAKWRLSGFCICAITYNDDLMHESTIRLDEEVHVRV